MIRQGFVALGALLAVVASPLTAHAAADDGRTILILNGAVRCALSADNVPRGGGPMAVCQQVNGQPWGQGPWEAGKSVQRLNLAVLRGTGEFYWDQGTIESAGGGADVGGGKYQADGWTVQEEGLRTRITYDATKHGMFVAVGDVRSF